MSYVRKLARFRSRAVLASVLGALAVLAALVVMPGSATAAAQASRGRAVPAGVWSLQLHFSGQTFKSGVTFSPGGRAFLIGFEGAGSWHATGKNRFSWQIEEGELGANGTYQGAVIIHQVGVLHGSTLTSTGISRQYNANDQLIRTIRDDITGTRS